MARLDRFGHVLSVFPFSRRILKRARRARGAGAALASIEIASGFALALGLSIRFVSVLIVVLLGAFSIALTRVLLERGEIACGCFGSASSAPVTIGAIARNLALICLVLVGNVAMGLSLNAVVQERLPAAVFGASLLLQIQLGLAAWVLWGVYAMSRMPGYVTRLQLSRPAGLETWWGTRDVQRRRDRE